MYGILIWMLESISKFGPLAIRATGQLGLLGFFGLLGFGLLVGNRRVRLMVAGAR